MSKYILLGVNVFHIIDVGITSIFLLIDAKIYGLIAYLYSLYIKLASAEIFTSDLYQDISRKVYTIIGVIALFIVAYSLLRVLVNPDGAGKGEKGGTIILRNFLFALVLIGFIPTIFDFLYSFQDAILNYNTIPKLILGDSSSSDSESSTIYYQDEDEQYVFTDDCQASSYEEALNTCEKITTEASTTNLDVLDTYGYNMAYTILNGFLYPADGRSNSEVEVDASEYFNTDTTLSFATIGCLAVGGLATAGVVALEVATSPTTGFATLAAIPGSISALGGTIALACGTGAALGAATSGIGYAVTLEKYTWQNATDEIILSGDFDRITPFASAIKDGEMNYTMIISSIAGIIVLYMMASFCIDLGLRAAKLVFFEMLAPICLLMSVIPSNKNLLGNYVKNVLTTWAEVFIRIFCVCGLAYLVSKLNTVTLDSFGLLAKAIIVMGLIMFVKQLPKLIGDITGIKSEGMKLGIMEKLREGGALTTAAVIGGGITAGVNNITHAGSNIRNKWKEDNANGTSTIKKIGHAVSGVGSGVLSTGAGLVSGSARGYGAGRGAKNFRDVRDAASRASTEAARARSRRESFKEEHGGTIVGSGLGHAEQAATSVVRWATGSQAEAYQAKLDLYSKMQKKVSSIKDQSDAIAKADKMKGTFTIGTRVAAEAGVKSIEVPIIDRRTGRQATDPITGKKMTAIRQVPILDQNSTISEAEAVIRTFEASGDEEKAKRAAKMRDALGLRNKDISKGLQRVALNQTTAEAQAFNAAYTSSTSGFDVLTDAKADLSAIKSDYQVLQDLVNASPSADPVKEFTSQSGTNEVDQDNISDFKDILNSSISEVRTKIGIEENRGRGPRSGGQHGGSGGGRP